MASLVKSGLDKMKKGFTLVETLLVMGIFGILIALGSINYFSTVNQTNVGVTKDVLVADLRSAQNKAMSGAALAGTTVDSWGLKLLESSYVIFPGPTYTAGATGNYIVQLPIGMSVSTSLPSSQVLFSKGTGEIVSYNSDTDVISLSVGSSSKTIELNRLGVITSP